jgi:AcrR family transcriptional regulator
MNDAKPAKDRILDAAEALFAIDGYDAVTLRQIAKDARVDVALANYHFGPKRDLFDAVLLRRAQILNDLRIKELEACEEQAAPNPPSIEAIIKAFLHPLLIRPETQGPGWRNYYALVAYINNSRRWGDSAMSKYFDPLVKRFIRALKKSMPQIADEDMYWCYQFLSGALVLSFAETGRIDRLSDGLCKSEDLEAAYERMVPFVVAGFKTFSKSN